MASCDDGARRVPATIKSIVLVQEVISGDPMRKSYPRLVDKFIHKMSREGVSRLHVIPMFRVDAAILRPHLPDHIEIICKSNKLAISRHDPKNDALQVWQKGKE